MSSVHTVQCPGCHGSDFDVVDDSTGLIRCLSCRRSWVDQHFVKLTETEKFLRAQGKSQAAKPARPRSAPESEQTSQLLALALQALNFHPLRALRRAVGRLAWILLWVAIAAVIGFLAVKAGYLNLPG